MNKLILLISLFGGLFLLGSQCAPDLHDDSHHHFLKVIREHKSPVEYQLNRNEILDTTLLIKVHATLPEMVDFFTEKRTHKLTSYECSNCHTEPLEIMKKSLVEGTKKAHWDIAMAHATENVMNCSTCHAKDNMNLLTSLTGALIEMDKSYQLCSQCHSRQYHDWEGGAHGKQLNGWAPPRVAKTCVSCHNPHQPAFPKRFPARLNTQNPEE